MKQPDYYNTVMPYLILNDPEGFLDFTRRLFDAEEMMISRDEKGGMRHGEIRIGDSAIMFGQSGGEWKTQPAGLYIQVSDCDASYKKALVLGAASVMEPSDQDYGRNAGVADPFGNTWWLVS